MPKRGREDFTRHLEGTVFRGTKLDLNVHKIEEFCFNGL